MSWLDRLAANLETSKIERSVDSFKKAREAMKRAIAPRYKGFAKGFKSVKDKK